MSNMLHGIINGMDNLNNSLNTVVELCQKEYSTGEIYKILSEGTVMEKQVAVLNLSEIRSYDEAKILMDNLTGIDGKVRQAVAYKILQLMPEYKDFFKCFEFYRIFAKSIIDIDSNVCRLDIDAIQYLKDDKSFSEFIANEMKNIILASLEKLSKISYKSKKYTSNKQYFKIYWCLETLSEFYFALDYKYLLKILTDCSSLSEYTIREKCAVILKKLPDSEEVNNIRKILMSDENYYVRNI